MTSASPGPQRRNDQTPAQLLFGLAALGFSLFLLIQFQAQTTWVSGQPLAAQPALLSLVSIAGMAVFSVSQIIACYKCYGWALTGAVGELGALATALEYVVWFMVYVWLVPLTGYLPTTLLFCALLTLRVGYRSAKALAAALLTGLLTVVLFKSLLSVKIPGGAIYEHLSPALRNVMVLYF